MELAAALQPEFKYILSGNIGWMLGFVVVLLVLGLMKRKARKP